MNDAEVIEKLRFQLLSQERDAMQTIATLRRDLSDAYAELAKFSNYHANNLAATLKARTEAMQPKPTVAPAPARDPCNPQPSK